MNDPMKELMALAGSDPLPDLTRDEDLYLNFICRLIKAGKLSELRAVAYLKGNAGSNSMPLKLTWKKEKSVICKK